MASLTTEWNRKHYRSVRGNRGISLIMVMLILVVVSLLGIGGIQVSMMGERGARNDRDYQIAWQSAELGLMDAEFDLIGPGPSSRRASFNGINKMDFPIGCGNSGNQTGLCKAVTKDEGIKPVWLTAAFDDTSSTSNTVAFGTFTGRAFATGSIGVQPAAPPRYIIEVLDDKIGSKALDASTPPPQAYRVTSMGFGPRNDIQAVVQMLFRN